ncbi:MAG: hypothetical protein H7329_04450, partial [Opitutaceae bacterium]|nr:hypothetical protein [Cytophagales bacterium]
MNLLLISLGFPPVIIKKGLEEQQYKQYLADIQAYGGIPDLFYELMASLLTRSQELILKAIEGVEIDEEEDWKKELKLIKQNFGKNSNKSIRSSDNVLDTVEEFACAFQSMRSKELAELEGLFMDSKILFQDYPIEIKGKTVRTLSGFPIRSIITEISLINFVYRLNSYKTLDLNIESAESNIEFKFEPLAYFITIRNSNFKLEKLYGSPFLTDEVTQIVNEVGKDIISQIKSKLGQL